MSKEIKKDSNPKFFFLHLLSIVTLYVSAVSFITMIFQVINIYFPDAMQGDIYYRSENTYQILRSAISFLLVMFPVYIGTLFTLDKVYLKDKKTRDSAVRKWLIYLTLFVGALTVLFTLVSVFNTFLDGELTTRFFLKVLTILFVAGGVLSYYGHDLKKFK
ncbi:MAG: hypothetical protein HOE80_03000 [Candidatus Magasanikbacteria bacterium]|nr:hypothetical protein [Candidatus Magasanikbacteria bacterium]MBT4071667.1 hypothetical protein [Candidatus Magasanikbacteria bacterium]